jgi:hypothetical protein
VQVDELRVAHVGRVVVGIVAALVGGQHVLQLPLGNMHKNKRQG